MKDGKVHILKSNNDRRQSANLEAHVQEGYLVQDIEATIIKKKEAHIARRRHH